MLRQKNERQININLRISHFSVVPFFCQKAFETRGCKAILRTRGRANSYISQLNKFTKFSFPRSTLLLTSTVVELGSGDQISHLASGRIGFIERSAEQKPSASNRVALRQI
jgi:hypothetical protein